MAILSLSFCGWLALQGFWLPNIDFSSGTLSNWEGDGFRVVKLADMDQQPDYAVSSEDRGIVGRKALLHRAIVVPEGAGVIRFEAYAARAPGCEANENLDVALLAAGKRIIPKKVRTASGWQAAPVLLPRKDGRPQEYIWPVDAYAGQTVRIVLVDEDDRPDCYVHCSGFRILWADEIQGREFSEFMVRLTEEHKLTPVVRYDSRHFTALSSADEDFTENLLRNCELMYSLFCAHFHRKGFTIQRPPAKLMLAIFDNQAGFEAYLGQKTSPLLGGMYHSSTNRFVMYDFGQNPTYLTQKQQLEQQGRQIASQMVRQRYIETLHREAQDYRTIANVGTIMHEVTHQLSFNCGMLNREGDVPFWLAEGLACYCEATSNGTWQGIGQPNPQRLATLSRILGQKGQLRELRGILEGDPWKQNNGDRDTVLLGYAQSWALFSMFMEEQPQNLKTYLGLIYSRRTPDRRLADFQQAFGGDLAKLERRHAAYIQRLVQQYARK